ncbi:hypothetical protein FOZ62_029144 [Perkinsus olseni]|uniref:RRM domain-containing protein n=1 Tax=Perkinsus olseni TaxID=32597 RepID=A0A7J6RNY0_PEROL|nr:hypothetical protein FOZ62_029144 [Perkinsus olseni]
MPPRYGTESNPLRESRATLAAEVRALREELRQVKRGVPPPPPLRPLRESAEHPLSSTPWWRRSRERHDCSGERDDSYSPERVSEGPIKARADEPATPVLVSTPKSLKGAAPSEKAVPAASPRSERYGSKMHHFEQSWRSFAVPLLLGVDREEAALRSITHDRPPEAGAPLGPEGTSVSLHGLGPARPHRLRDIRKRLGNASSVPNGRRLNGGALLVYRAIVATAQINLEKMPRKFSSVPLPPERRGSEYCHGSANPRTHCRIVKCNGGRSYYAYFEPKDSSQFECVLGPLRPSFDDASRDASRMVAVAAASERELVGLVMKLMMQEGAIVHRKAPRKGRPGMMLESPYIRVDVPGRAGGEETVSVALRGIRFNTVECAVPVAREVEVRLNHTKMGRVIDCIVELFAKCADENIERPDDHTVYRFVRDTLGCRLPLPEGDVMRLIAAMADSFPNAGVAAEAPEWLHAFREKSKKVDAHVAEVVKGCESERRKREKRKLEGTAEAAGKRPRKHTPADRTVFVSNIDRGTGLGELRDAVNGWMGEKGVDRCAIPVEHQTGAVRGHAFLYFKSPEAADRFVDRSTREEFVVKGRILRTAKVLEENLEGEELQAWLADQKKQMFRLPSEVEAAIRSKVAEDDGCNISLVKHKVETELGHPIDLAKYGFKSWSKAVRSVPGVSIEVVHNEEKEGKLSGYVARLDT